MKKKTSKNPNRLSLIPIFIGSPKAKSPNLGNKSSVESFYYLMMKSFPDEIQKRNLKVILFLNIGIILLIYIPNYMKFHHMKD